MLCESTLAVTPHCCPLLEKLSELHEEGGDADEAANVWLRAHRLHPHDARVFYSLCKCLHAQVGKHICKPVIITKLLTHTHTHKVLALL